MTQFTASKQIQTRAQATPPEDASTENEASGPLSCLRMTVLII